MKAIKRDEHELKNSGVEWIGKIPIAWELRKVKYVADFNPKVTIQFDTKLPIGYVPMDAVKFGYMEPLEHDYKSLSTGLTQFQEDDIVMAKVTPCFENGEIAIAKNLAQGVGFGSSELFVYRTTEINQRYFFYYLQQLGFVDKATSTMTGTGGLKRISSYFANNAEVTFPSAEEQQAIANYLDDHCSKIDAIIAEAKASIEEYQELKQAVIYEAVTKGLDKTVEMKDSGVEWVEKIPNNWHIVKITRILDKEHPYAIGDGDHGSIKTEQYRDSGIPFIRVQNLGWGTALNMDNVVYISEEDNKQIQNSTLRPNDILFAKTGATIGKTAIMPEEIPIANTTSHVGKISISKEHNSRYIFYVLSSQIGYRQFWDIAMQKTTRPELSIEETKSIKVVLPADKTIEDSIVNYLDEKIPVFDDMINTKASLIEDLEAYKKSLIYEVVTGKRKVVA